MRERDFKYKWLSALAKAADLDYDVRGLLLAIAEQYMQPDGMNVWASQARIAKDCGGNRKGVNRMIGEAERAGWIVKEKRPNCFGRVVLHLTPAVPVQGQSLVPDSGPSCVPEAGHKPIRVNPVIEPNLAPAGDGSTSAESASLRLVRLRLAADAGSLPEDALLAAALRPDVMPAFDPEPELDELTGVPRAADFLALLDAVLQVSAERLPKPMKPRQLEMTVQRLSQMVEESEAWAGPAAWQVFWSAWAPERWNHPTHVERPVEFVVGSVMKALTEERRASC